METRLPRLLTEFYFIKDKGWILIKDLTEEDKQNIVCYADESVIPSKKEKYMGFNYERTEKAINSKEIIENMPTCLVAISLLKDWVNSNKKSILTTNWLKDNPQAIDFALKLGYIKEIKPKTNWDGLEIQRNDVNKTVTIYDRNTGRDLLGFRADGSIYRNQSGNAGNSHGNFDAQGRIIID